MKELFPPQIILAFFLGALFFGSRFVFSFTEPSSTPPFNNTPAPLNVSSTGQSKAGGLILNTGGAVNGLIVQLGNVGIGTAEPTQKLDVIGKIKTDSITAGAIGGTVTAGGWGSYSPGNLTAAVDSDENTSTTEGGTGGCGSTGWIQIDLGSLKRGVLYSKIGVRVASGPGYQGKWLIQTSADGTNWATSWTETRQIVGTEIILFPSTPIWSRYVRFAANDQCSGIVALKVYEAFIKAYE